MMNESLSKEKASTQKLEQELESNLNLTNLKKLNLVHTTKEMSSSTDNFNFKGILKKENKIDNF